MTATFSEPVDSNTLSDSTITLLDTKTGASVPATSVTLSPSGKMLTFDPSVAKLAKKSEVRGQDQGRLRWSQGLGGQLARR